MAVRDGRRRRRTGGGSGVVVGVVVAVVLVGGGIAWFALSGRESGRDSGTKKKVVGQKEPSAKPVTRPRKGRTLTLGQSNIVGKLEVTPLDITLKRVRCTITQPMGNKQTAVSRTDVLVLRCRLKNISAGQVFNPMETWRPAACHVKDDFGNRLKPMADTWPFRKRFSFEGQIIRELKPGEAMETIILSEPSKVDAATKFTWTLYFKSTNKERFNRIEKGPPFVLKFTKSDIRRSKQAPSSKRPTSGNPYTKDAKRAALSSYAGARSLFQGEGVTLVRFKARWKEASELAYALGSKSGDEKILLVTLIKTNDLDTGYLFYLRKADWSNDAVIDLKEMKKYTTVEIIASANKKDSTYPYIVAVKDLRTNREMWARRRP